MVWGWINCYPSRGISCCQSQYYGIWSHCIWLTISWKAADAVHIENLTCQLYLSKWIERNSSWTKHRVLWQIIQQFAFRARERVVVHTFPPNDHTIDTRKCDHHRENRESDHQRKYRFIYHRQYPAKYESGADLHEDNFRGYLKVSDAPDDTPIYTQRRSGPCHVHL